MEPRDLSSDFASLIEYLTPAFQWFIGSVSQNPFEWAIIIMIIIGTDFIKRLWAFLEVLIAVLFILFLVFCVAAIIEWLCPGLITWLFSGGIRTILYWAAILFASLVAITIVVFGGLVVYAIFNPEEEEKENG